MDKILKKVDSGIVEKRVRNRRKVAEKRERRFDRKEENRGCKRKEERRNRELKTNVKEGRVGEVRIG